MTFMPVLPVPTDSSKQFRDKDLVRVSRTVAVPYWYTFMDELVGEYGVVDAGGIGQEGSVNVHLPYAGPSVVGRLVSFPLEAIDLVQRPASQDEYMEMAVPRKGQ